MGKQADVYIPSNIIISENTQSLFQRRKMDDYRINFAHYVLFEDGLRNDIKEWDPDGDILRKAAVGDTFSYTVVPDNTTIKMSLEHNLANIARLRNQKNVGDNIGKVWVFCYDMEDYKKDDDIPDSPASVVIYKNPDAVDINKIIKEKRLVLGLFIVIEYKYQDADRLEWAFISPGDPNNVEEYSEYLLNREAEELEKMFYMSFRKKSL